MPLHHSHQTRLLHRSTHLQPSQECHFLDVLWIHHNHQSSCCNSAIGTYRYISSFLRHTDSHCCTPSCTERKVVRGQLLVLVFHLSNLQIWNRHPCLTIQPCPSGEGICIPNIFAKHQLDSCS